MRKSLKTLFNGTADKVYGNTDMVADEMFNTIVVWLGEWKAIKHQPPVGTGKWQLHNIADDPTEIVNVADQHPDIIQKLILAYEKYANDIGVVVPRGETYYDSVSSTRPPVNQSRETNTSADITPEKFGE